MFNLWIWVETYNLIANRKPKDMGNDVTTMRPPPMEVENNIQDTAVNQEEWHVFELHLPTVISGGLGLVGLGIAACGANYCYRKWVARTHKQNEREIGMVNRRAQKLLELANIEEGNGGANAPLEGAGGYKHRFN